MRKLSPVADCLHLQLYRDSKDRYKQGQTKASLSLQHFLAVESGFTLDKESNTIAIICQDVTVVLAFDTRERLIQWQVKIANNLGEDQQFLIQISSAPARTKIATGPARLHVQEHRFCLAQGVPPRLIGCWQISQLRKYGVVENRFCFEGGSRCGRGEGVFVLVTDEGDEICRVLTLAADGKLNTQRRPHSRQRNASVCESPRKQRESSRLLATEACASGGGGTQCGCMAGGGCTVEAATVWPSAETSCCDYGDTTSVAEFNDKMDGRVGGDVGGLERCMSCISKLGAMSRSSTAAFSGTAANTLSTNFTPAWTMEAHQITVNCQQNLQEISHSNFDEYSVPNPLNDENRMVPVTCQFCPVPLGAPPSRPPKPSQLGGVDAGGAGGGGGDSPLKKKQRKPPMPLPHPHPTNHQCHHHHHQIADSANAFENYDFPRHSHATGQKDECQVDDYYDTPKNMKECLEQNYGNYDTPPPPAALPLQPLHACNRNMLESEARRGSLICPCHRMFGWAESWMLLPYCRRGNGIENTSLPFHKVKLDGEGRMPVVNKSGEVAIYATVNKLKKTSKNAPSNDSTVRRPSENSVDETAGSNYVNVELGGNVDIGSNNSHNYANLEFAQSLEYYENVRDLKRPSAEDCGKFCAKCGHTNVSKVGGGGGDNSKDDYLMMEPMEGKKEGKNGGSNFPGYLPMLPISQQGGGSCANLTEKAASVPSLVSSDVRMRSRMRSECCAVVSGVQSASSSPYLKRMRSGEDCAAMRKRSSSADSTRYIDNNLESITERTVSSGSSTQVNNSVDSLCSQSGKTDASVGLSTNSLYCKNGNTNASVGLSSNSLCCQNGNTNASAGSSLSNSGVMCNQIGKTDASVGSLCSRSGNTHMSVGSSLSNFLCTDSIGGKTVRMTSSSLCSLNSCGNKTNPFVSSLLANNGVLCGENATNKMYENVSSSTLCNGSRGERDQLCNGSGVERDQLCNTERDLAATPVNDEEDLLRGGSSDSLRTLVGGNAPVHIRRASSSSIPCHKSSSGGHNRDSSSSNDSGVSVASLQRRGADFAEFELPLTTARSSRRHLAAVLPRFGRSCGVATLPRRSRSSDDPLQALQFQFQQRLQGGGGLGALGGGLGVGVAALPAKSASAEAEVPLYSVKRDALRGCVSPAGDLVLAAAYLDSRSTSSGTSDMSDYFETLSLSSYSSSDTPDSLRLSRPAATTLRPRSGKEYQKIDRCSVMEPTNTAFKKPAFGAITEKTEIPPPDCSK
ncbi:uncharacterized protein LOC111058118 isoform X1 [Nilaparvata lugens]|uniref:uncharacterized protein LOC111058118 isoform X1 n=1 Tax=Nilaparvata lugens TaxID=108931 RepID=UPI00193E0408|nr:uncharacterized protein LOC111058118 isoform X1 [Nilaparvata lugens]XP_039283307.1 uncharacterized protein LOC111058118 isoform X1 [Nilaparvata lugens]